VRGAHRVDEAPRFGGVDGGLQQAAERRRPVRVAALGTVGQQAVERE